MTSVYEKSLAERNEELRRRITEAKEKRKSLKDKFLESHKKRECWVGGKRKLKAKWTPEAQADIASMHNIDLDEELSKSIIEDITKELDNDFFKTVDNIIGAGTRTRKRKTSKATRKRRSKKRKVGKSH